MWGLRPAVPPRLLDKAGRLVSSDNTAACDRGKVRHRVIPVGPEVEASRVPGQGRLPRVSAPAG